MALSSLAWPVLIAVAFWRLWPHLTKLLGREKISVGAGGLVISAEGAQVAALGKDVAARFEGIDRAISDLSGELMTAIETTAHLTGRSALDFRNQCCPRIDRPIARAVLWVDDNPSNNAVFVGSLVEEGCKVLVAITTKEGLALLKEHIMDVDAIITGMSRDEGGEVVSTAGMELITEVRRRFAMQIPVAVFSSTRSIKQYGLEALRAGANYATDSPTRVLAWAIRPSEEQSHSPIFSDFRDGKDVGSLGDGVATSPPRA